MPPGIVTPYEIPPTTKAPRRPGVALRLRVWRNRLDLDRELAGGADPGRREDLALRAMQLRDQRRRELEAQGIEKLVRVADSRRAAVATPLAPFRPRQVRPNRQRLLDLASRLRDGEPATVRGLAMGSLMLEDTRGPLTASSDPRTLARAVRAARAALDL